MPSSKPQGKLIFSPKKIFAFSWWFSLGFFCCLAQAAAETGSALSNTLTAAGEKEKPVSVFADYLSYEEEAGKLVARGNVRLWYAQLTLTAEQAEADLEEQVVHASGNVVLTEQDRTIHCGQLDYQLKTKSAQARGIIFTNYPWYYQGEAVEKKGEKWVVVTHSSFTTCNARHPHYHITADNIVIELGESLTAYNAVFYVGATPLFYFPWIRRSIKDRRPPLSIRVGYNDYEGLYSKLRFNYFLWEQNYGDVDLDVMQKTGLGFGLNHFFHYNALGVGNGNLAFLYINDKQSLRERWTASLDDRQELSERDLIQLRAEYLSDRSFNREFSSGLVDSYQQKSSLAYSRRADDYYLGLVTQDIETLDVVTEQYYTSLRELPSANFTLNPQKVAQLGMPLYFSFNSAWRRYHAAGSEMPILYQNELSLIPTFTETYTLPITIPTQPSLSGSLSFPLRETYMEQNPPQNLDASYGTNLTLTNKWVNYQRSKPTYLFQSRISHDFSRRLPWGNGINALDSGVTGHHLGLSLDYFVGSLATLQSSTGYQLYSYSHETDWHNLVDPVSFSGNLNPLQNLSFNWQGIYNYQKGRVMQGNFSTQTRGQKWNLYLNTSYNYLEASVKPHTVFASLNGGYSLGIGVMAQSSLQYDFNKKEMTRISFNLSRDLHCWAIQGGFTQYADGKNEIGLGINLKAFPEVKAGMGGMEGFSVGQ